MSLLSTSNDAKGLEPYLSPAAAWAFSIGTSIGWGSFVITSNNYLFKAGPAGSCIGMLIAMAIMLVVARNYHYLMNRYPDAGGVYAYAKQAFGYDYGFLTAWFVAMTYMAILWANATSVPLFAHYFFGDLFKVGFLYSVFGYEIYLGEMLLTIAALVVFGFICILIKRFAARLMVGLALAFAVGIAICFATAAGGLHGDLSAFTPAFIPDSSAFIQVITIACISPWAFIGFENISHMSEEFKFPRSSSYKVLAASVVATTALYLCVILLSVTTHPPQFENWFDYVGNLDTLEGIEALPAFYAAHHYLGDAGVDLLFVALFALIATSLIGNMTALSRLFYALSKDRILPDKLAALNEQGTPHRALLAIIAVSCIVPFLGRTAIGWIVDVTTIGATITYGFVSASAYKIAKTHGSARYAISGIAGLVIMVAMGIVLILPNLFATSTMATESYFLFTIWAILGLLFFRYILHSDPDNRFGESVVVWIVLIAFVLFMSCVWMEQSSERAADAALADMQAHYESVLDESGAARSADSYYNREHHMIHFVNTRNSLVIIGIFALSLGVLISNYSFMRRRERESVLQLGVERIRANTDQLTGVRNKYAYAEVESEFNARLSRDPSMQFGVAVCDLNDLKAVNDTHGHYEGDAYIVDACRLICRTFKHSPVFRVGGDEFAVLLEGQDFDNRKALVGEINAQSEVNLADGGLVIAIGMAEYRRGLDKDVLAVYTRADDHMYERKRQLKQLRAERA